MAVLITLVIFGIVVCIHEFGHFIAARKSGILVEEFAIGMGPILLKKQGIETLYTIRAFPLGGFCKMLGEEGRGEEQVVNDERSFNSKSVLKRFIVMVAGAAMNFLLGYIVFFIILLNGYALPEVHSVMDNSPAYNIGLQSGDKIISINDKSIHTFNEFYYKIQQNKKNEVLLGVKRGDEKFYLSTKLSYNEKTNNYTLGFYPVMRNSIFASEDSEYFIDSMKKAGFFETMAQTYWFITFHVETSLSAVLELATGKIGVSELSGPVGIATAVEEEYNETIKLGIKETLLSMSLILANISLSLGFFNLLPLPALDGGKIVFLAIEAVRGKPIDQEKEAIIHIVGFFLIIGLGVYVMFSDIIKLF